MIGTVSLPIAMVLTIYLIISSIFSTLPSAVPLILLASTLFLPAVLVLVTTRKPIYIGWMFIYLLALPVWNLALPLYAFWHFDDFSWGSFKLTIGDTRKVEGETKGQDHSTRQGAYEIGAVPLKKYIRNNLDGRNGRSCFEWALWNLQGQRQNQHQQYQPLEGFQKARTIVYEGSRPPIITLLL
jgi:chitin synthase